MRINSKSSIASSGITPVESKEFFLEFGFETGQSNRSYLPKKPQAHSHPLKSKVSKMEADDVKIPAGTSMDASYFPHIPP